MLGLIFGENKTVAFLVLIVYGCSLFEHYILRSGNDNNRMVGMALTSSSSIETQFNFANFQTKLNYAKAKFLVSVALITLYMPLSIIYNLIISSSGIL